MALESKRIKFFKYKTDFILALILLVLYPFMKIFSIKIEFNDIISVLKSDKTWVSYIENDINLDKLPKLKTGVYIPLLLKDLLSLTSDEIHEINIGYASSYSIWNDFNIVFSNLLENTDKLK
ncbi:MAG: hypothetical protein R2771_07965 [Saprospiraceae bacterium]